MSYKKENNKECTVTINRCHYVDGNTLIQTLYNNKKTKLIVCSEDKTIVMDEYGIDDKKVMIPIHDVYLNKETVIVPSGINANQLDLLYDDIITFINSTLIAPVDDIKLMAAYVLYTWMQDKVKTAPYLWILGDYGTAKSRIGDLVGLLGFNSTFLGTSVTSANIFRMQDCISGTLILDEMDMDFSKKESDLIKVLNGGYKHPGTIYRTENRGGEQFKPIAYSVFGAKVIMSRDEPNDVALKSRCFVIETEKVDISALKKHDISLNIDDSILNKAEALRNRLLAYRFLNFNSKIQKANHSYSESVSLRGRQLINTMLSVLPKKLHDELLPILEEHLFEDGISLSIKEEKNVKSIIDSIISCHNELPIQISFMEICKKLEEVYSMAYEPKEIANIVKRLKYETKRISSGMVMIIRDVGNVGNVGDRNGKEGL